ncbi:putative quinol monooxygenase [Glycomyces harbinensis]|uniref:Quinol monooxygenase YgiN n=1 Tax=Glycomyces harbinensis TaxID=58114 RepID=A0A1G6RCH8_9ACTN|nr:putative quinol monooxygenase [Glycomyces harbinensis]SDD02329.1 Quinol monooxygenase YgiN [Glycomyces harbinensis]
MITVHAYLHALPEHREAYLDGLRALQAATLEHDTGCLAYRFWEALDEPNTFICVEAWADIAALNAHLDAPHHTEIAAHLDPYRAAPADVQVFESTPISL